MKPTLILITLIVLAFQFVRAADEPTFFAARGEYHLSGTTTLIITEEEQAPHYMLKSIVQQADTGTTVSHGAALDGTKTGEAFFFYWDADSRLLWWATRQRLGYCDIHNPQSARSEAAARSEPFRADFPPRPKGFLAEVERSFGIQP